jgi:hypothetical protein
MYKLTEDPNVIINLDTTEFIPNGARQWDDYQTWLAAGNTPDPIGDLAYYQAAQIVINTQTCAYQIVQGFPSAALGDTYTYPSKETDQSNLNGSVVDSIMAQMAGSTTYSTPFWCMDSSGNWAFHMHNITQIQQVGQDGKQYILGQMAHNAYLTSLVLACTTIEEVQAVTWDTN